MRFVYVAFEGFAFAVGYYVFLPTLSLIAILLPFGV